MTVGFIGAGNMAEAIVRGALAAGVLQPGDVIVSNPGEDRRQLFEQLGCRASANNADVLTADAIVLAIKPQVFPQVADEIRDALPTDRLVISIMAGLTTSGIATALSGSPGGQRRIVRTMPNLPLQVGVGMTGIFAGEHASAGDVAFVQRLFDASGQTLLVDDEAVMHTVTALAGSGPAFIFAAMEAMISAATDGGLTREQATAMAIQTVRGAAVLLHERAADNDGDPAQWRARVTSKGGTTAAGLNALQTAGGPAAFEAAIEAARHRGRELAGEV